jgi:hypothetical protein
VTQENDPQKLPPVPNPLGHGSPIPWVTVGGGKKNPEIMFFFTKTARIFVKNNLFLHKKKIESKSIINSKIAAIHI